MRVQFTIPGEPKGKGRHRTATRGAYAVQYSDQKTVIYENLTKMEFRRQCKAFRFPDGTELDMRIYAYYGIPKSVSKKKRELMLAGEIRPTKKPDWDNIGKIISDSLNQIGYRDDAEIVDGMVRKFYSDEPRVVVVVQEARHD